MEKVSDDPERGDLMAAACPSRDVLRRLTGRWGMLVLRVLSGGPQRFSGLRRQIGGVSERMLAQTLQGLESDGLLLRRDFQTVPPHVEYELTPMGHEAARRVDALLDWIEAALPQIARGWAQAG
ncbi:winged helix-turn-helix transcriptional regulator [Paracoccus lutimaris]|uniref:HxlR family transcriptional regulator n=1 Tax=Paracoccus lutimaris TaxID=1490030 RepID=A0A368ZCL6_9RHOB|nr:helix-turn-helix domain-containing protein [Paracoccus lutimaris]RCW88937.1 HxlR family transcriptional regulator [Paracoccus lutimaris]